MSDDKRSQVREHIEISAIRCFVETSFHGTTTAERPRAAGTSMGGLCGHYQVKMELFASVVGRDRRLFAQPDNRRVHSFETDQFPDHIPAPGAVIEAVFGEHRESWLLWYVDVLACQGRHFSGTFLDAVPLHPALDARSDELDKIDRSRMAASLAFCVLD
jgi:AcrR family transcriptional regulator